VEVVVVVAAADVVVVMVMIMFLSAIEDVWILMKIRCIFSNMYKKIPFQCYRRGKMMRSTIQYHYQISTAPSQGKETWQSLSYTLL